MNGVTITYQCAKCRIFIKKNAKKCPRCGQKFGKHPKGW